MLQFHPFIYLAEDHLHTQTNEIIYVFSMNREHSPAAIAVFHCVNSDCFEWKSPPRAPFGGVQCSTDCEAEDLLFFMSCIRDFIIKRRGTGLTIKTAPSGYDLRLHHLVDQCFQQTGFSKIENHSNHLITVGSDFFSDNIRPAERRKLQQCKLAGFLSNLDDQITLPEAYRFLVHCRNQAGYKISMSLEQLNVLYTKFPQQIRFFNVVDADQIIALTITIKVTDQILYNFLMSDLPEYRTFSPVVLLMETVYHYCQQEKISCIDLGISVDEHGQQKPSLSRFKKNIGGQECEKITYQLKF